MFEECCLMDLRFSFWLVGKRRTKHRCRPHGEHGTVWVWRSRQQTGGRNAPILALRPWPVTSMGSSTVSQSYLARYGDTIRIGMTHKQRLRLQNAHVSFGALAAQAIPNKIISGDKGPAYFALPALACRPTACDGAYTPHDVSEKKGLKMLPSFINGPF